MYSILLLIVVVLFSGELIWKERSLRLNEIQDALPAPSGVYFGAKLAALLLAVAAFLAGRASLALAGFQLSQGYGELELGLYARGAAIAAVYPLLMAVLSAFCHVMREDKLVGYGLVIGFILGWDLLEELGFEHHLYRYASLPAGALLRLRRLRTFPARRSAGSASTGRSARWCWWALRPLLEAGPGRGLAGPPGGRARPLPRRPPRLSVWRGTLGFVAVGGWLFYNTNVRNEYLPSTEAADRRAEYERKYGRYRDLELPRIVAVRADVDIFPERGSLEIRGAYRLKNKPPSRFATFTSAFPGGSGWNRLDLAAQQVVLADRPARLRHLPATRAAGARRWPRDRLRARQWGGRGFDNQDTETAVIGNGTYFTRRDCLPDRRLRRLAVSSIARRASGGGEVSSPFSTFPPAGDLAASPQHAPRRRRRPGRLRGHRSLPAATRSPSPRASCSGSGLEQGRRLFPLPMPSSRSPTISLSPRRATR